ncbi:ROK family protein [Microbacterium excoecariae]|uniref:ROK family protein n=1 Tax=Microbacterium excoecariae TaxID=2715210 RepID=UPI0014099FEB|nr:ROK family protein [Microbacterium excoecariae]NHI15843.1 ROK family protein [Microbacterium excoecariae]
MTRFALAVDVGGTKIEAALVDEAGAVLAASRTRQPTGRAIDPAGMRQAVSAVVAHALDALPQGAALAGAGIGSAGPVDLVAGTIAPVNMPGLAGFPLAEAVRDAVVVATGQADPRVVLRHDGGALALAEAWLGAAAGARASLSIVVSTGVGGGIVVDGRPVGGSSGNAGHLGQTHAAEHGGELTLEEIASGPASVTWAQLAGWRGTTGEQLAADARRADRVAREAIERSARAVGRALADASTLLDLEVVAISGGFSFASDDYVELVAASLADWAVLPYAARTRVVRSGLGPDGPLVGAAALALRA